MNLNISNDVFSNEKSNSFQSKIKNSNDIANLLKRWIRKIVDIKPEIVL